MIDIYLNYYWSDSRENCFKNNKITLLMVHDKKPICFMNIQIKI
jgi:hypothetical protein